VEHSGELGATPASDSRHTVASHLGRAHAGAYRGDGECAGALGGELEALVRSVASGGLSPAMARGGALRLWLRSRVEGGGRDPGDRMDGGLLGARVGVPTRGWRWPAAARSSPAYGRHVAGAGWDEAGVHTRERGGGGRQAGPRSGPKGRRGWPRSGCPFSIFF